MGRALDGAASAWHAVRVLGLATLVLTGLVSACWWPVTKYPPGSVVHPMLPIRATGVVLVLSCQMVWEAVTLRRVGLAVRLALALIPLVAVGVAVAWPLGIQAVLHLDMSG